MGENEPATGDELQFDHAEYEAPGPSVPTCAACKQAIPEAYFEVNGIILCARCRSRIEASLTGGSGAARFLRAAAFGAGAAVAGLVIFCVVAHITGRQWGLISILVGFMVGGAVRKGSLGRGGWVYQGLAVFLTYTVIVASYLAIGWMMHRAEIQARGVPAPPAAAAAAAPEKVGAGATAQPVMPASPVLAIGVWTLVTLYVVGYSYTIPIQVGIQSPISLLIVGFALWEAWKLNRRVPLRITGPYRVGDGDGDGGGPGPGGVAAHA
jgi:hypothetical protein